MAHKLQKERGICPVNNCGKPTYRRGTQGYNKWCKSHTRGGGVSERKEWRDNQKTNGKQ